MISHWGGCWAAPITGQEMDEDGKSSIRPFIAIRNLVASDRPRQITSRTVKPELRTGPARRPQAVFSVVTGNMIEGEVGRSVNLAFTRLLE